MKRRISAIQCKIGRPNARATHASPAQWANEATHMPLHQFESHPGCASDWINKRLWWHNPRILSWTGASTQFTVCLARRNDDAADRLLGGATRPGRRETSHRACSALTQ